MGMSAVQGRCNIAVHRVKVTIMLYLKYFKASFLKINASRENSVHCVWQIYIGQNYPTPIETKLKLLTWYHSKHHAFPQWNWVTEPLLSYLENKKKQQQQTLFVVVVVVVVVNLCVIKQVVIHRLTAVDRLKC